MRVRDPAADRQAEPAKRARAFREPFEEMRDDLRRDARAVIFDDEQRIVFAHSSTRTDTRWRA